MEHYIPAIIMFSVTVLVASLFFVPTGFFQKRSALIRFYWNGFWVFLAMIAALAGGQNTLMLLRYDVDKFSQAALAGIIAAFVIFVMFAWLRLVGTTAFKFITPKLSPKVQS